jgi:hypothetical protein
MSTKKQQTILTFRKNITKYFLLEQLFSYSNLENYLAKKFYIACEFIIKNPK